MEKIFPPEIVNLSVENHFSRFSKFSKNIYTYTIFFFAGIVVSIFFIKTKITVQSKGIIRSTSETFKLISPVVAEVIKSKMSENILVNQGDTLIKLNSKKLYERLDHLKNLINQNKVFQQDLKLMLEYKYSNLKTDLYKSVHAQYRQKLAEYDLKINLLESSFNRIQRLFELDVLPLTEKEDLEFQLKTAIEEKNIFVIQKRSEWQKQLSEYELTNNNYKNEIREIQEELESYIILSPCNGYITNFIGIQTGAFVTTGQTLATISPNDTLICEYYVSPKNVGYLKNGMPVLFQIDAYNYNQWGLASGKILDISNDIYLMNNLPYYKVKCSLNEHYLTLKNGFKGYLKKGLTATARFQITERTLAQLLFDKTNNWLNPKLSK